MDAVDMYRHAFMKKLSGPKDKEIEAFWMYHDEFYAYTTRMKKYENAHRTKTERIRGCGDVEVRRRGADGIGG